MSEKINNILFISLSCVGDAVMTTPVLQALHQAYPCATVDIVADRRSEIIFRFCPYRGEIYFKDKSRFLRGAPALLKQLLGRQYDIIVDLRTDGLAYLLRGKKRYTKLGAVSYGEHAVDALMGIIKPVHGDQPLPHTHIWLNNDSQDYAAKLLAGVPPGRVLAIGPGCGGRRKEKFWPVENYIQLVNSVSDIFSAAVFLGGAEDAELSSKITSQLDLPCIDITNQTDLLQAAALLQQAAVFVGSDSGLGHVAGAVGTPTLTFFSVDNPERCLPRGPSPSWLMGENRDARNIPVPSAERKVRDLVQA